MDTVGAGQHQPVEIIELLERVIQGAPIIRGANHQRWQVKHAGSLRFEQASGLTLLFGGAGHHHRAVLQARIQANGSAFSLTIPPAC